MAAVKIIFVKLSLCCTNTQLTCTSVYLVYLSVSHNPLCHSINQTSSLQRLLQPHAVHSHTHTWHVKTQTTGSHTNSPTPTLINTHTCMCIHTLTHKHARSYKSHESGKFFPLSLFRLHFSLTTHCDCMRHDPWELTTKTSKLVPHTWKLFIFNFFGSLTTFGLCVAREEVYCLATKRLFLPLPSIKF